MTCTACGTRDYAALPRIALAISALLLGLHPVAAQEMGDWRASFQAGQRAQAEGENGVYAREMAAAVAAMPAGLLNRPFVQYHAARAHALEGDPSAAVRYLRMAWEEDIEALMISMAEYDPAFEAMRDDTGYRAVMDLSSAMALSIRPLAGSVVLIGGAGSTLAASVGPEGVLLVDTGYGAALPALRRALASLGAGSVDALVLTHPHEDHWGASPLLGGEATVYAHPNTAAAMDEPFEFMEGVVVPPKAAAAHPDVLVRDTTLRFNGEDVRIISMEAHTDADLAVYFTRSGVLHMGDAWLGESPLFFPGAKDPEAFLDRVDGFLAGLPPTTIVLGGHDEPTNLDAVRAQITRTHDCIDLVREAIADGATMAEAIERAEGSFTPSWVSFFYRAFTAGGALTAGE